MSSPVLTSFTTFDPDRIISATGHIVIFADFAQPLSMVARRINRLSKDAVSRAIKSDAFSKLKMGESLDIPVPAGVNAKLLRIIRLGAKPTQEEAQKAGGVIGALIPPEGVSVVGSGVSAKALDNIILGIMLRAYTFECHKTGDKTVFGPVNVIVSNPDVSSKRVDVLRSIAEGVFLTRDLVNEPANVLTTSEFASRLEDMKKLGLDVEVLEEEALEKLGMKLLLGVGHGSQSPSKVVVMHWKGAAKDKAPFALIGKGVVFDTGGISIKPSTGMEEMIMDMGGAATVAGVMRTLALRKARANVVGVVGIVENMPDGKAQRPGDIVRSMKGDTVEVINTDAEGRLVLADIMWYTQERFAPKAMIDLATLTGAIIVALGHETAGVFSNNDDLSDAFLKAARSEGEAAWRLPMGAVYDAKLKSKSADMMNVSNGRDAGSITAAQFLGRFVKLDLPWCHIDIAGTASSKQNSDLSPKGATGWGVMTLNRLIADCFEET